MNTGTRVEHLRQLAALVRYYSIAATTQAGSGHPSSSLSAADLMVALMFGGSFRYDTDNPAHPNNDRLLFSKGHASPLFYSLWLAAGAITPDELLTYRQFGSALEGHPTPEFRYTIAATGSLGQGLSIGVGLALNGKYLDQLPYRTYVLVGDSELAEGSQWEAIASGAHYRLDNLVAILDVNRLGQRGPTMYEHDLDAYQKRLAAFGWETILVDGHSIPEILHAYEQAEAVRGCPTMIIAKTIKGKGVPAIEDKDNWHGKALDAEELAVAVEGWPELDLSIRGNIPKPDDRQPASPAHSPVSPLAYPDGKKVATRVAYGQALRRIYPRFPQIVALDGEVSNSTMAETFAEAHRDRFFEMFIAEQNMAGVALGLSCCGKIPFASTFGAFWSRAFDQIRMSQYSDANIKFVGSHAGVSIGEDGPSQMALEDIALFRVVHDSVVLHPCDAVATEQCVALLAEHHGIGYLRTLRQATPILYRADDEFHIGGSHVLRQSERDVVTLVGAGTTVHEALAAHEELQRRDVAVRVIDLYSIKPLDVETLRAAAAATAAIITVEDHYAAGGLGEAVAAALAPAGAVVHSLAVRRKPRSGKPEELREFTGISRAAIIAKIEEVLAQTGVPAP